MAKLVGSRFHNERRSKVAQQTFTMATSYIGLDKDSRKALEQGKNVLSGSQTMQLFGSEAHISDGRDAVGTVQFSGREFLLTAQYDGSRGVRVIVPSGVDIHKAVKYDSKYGNTTLTIDPSSLDHDIEVRGIRNKQFAHVVINANHNRIERDPVRYSMLHCNAALTPEEMTLAQEHMVWLQRQTSR